MILQKMLVCESKFENTIQTYTGTNYMKLAHSKIQKSFGQMHVVFSLKGKMKAGRTIDL